MNELLTGGYNLMETDHGFWSINSADHIIFNGHFLEVVYFMVKKLGFHIDDIEEAIEIMEENGHNGIHFGVFKTVIYTFDAETKNGRKAS